VQVNSGGTFGGQSSIFSGGTRVQNAVECAHGTTSYTALTAAAASQEITIQTGMSGNVRYASVLLSETTQFAGGTGLTVSMGRPGSTTNAEMMNGAPLPLMVSGGDVNYASTRPIPPQITSAYSIVLNFAVSAGNVNAATAGSLTWELCGYAGR
jgi:ABC-type nitrate/sulfonate/bicarbonate transport system substrate-binding protein